MNEAVFSKIITDDQGLLDIEYIDPYSIFDLCLQLNVNVCLVDNISERNNQVTVNCEIIEIEPRPETYWRILEDLYKESAAE